MDALVMTEPLGVVATVKSVKPDGFVTTVAYEPVITQAVTSTKELSVIVDIDGLVATPLLMPVAVAGVESSGELVSAPRHTCTEQVCEVNPVPPGSANVVSVPFDIFQWTPRFESML